MTSLYERLQDGPQVDVDRAQLAPMERAELRTLSVSKSPTNEPAGYPGSFTSVYYLEGDERSAAKRFVEENREQLEAIDFSKHDIVTRSLDRSAYDWVLHFLGERELRKYQTVVYERRRDGTEWVIDRDHFELQHEHRYRRRGEPSVRIDPAYSVKDLYDEFGDRILESDLRGHPATAGDVRCLLDYYRVAGTFDCEPISVTADDAGRRELGVKKRTAGDKSID